MPELVSQSDVVVEKKYNAIVVVTSDSCYKDESLDESGTYVKEQLELTSLFGSVHKFIEADDKAKITHLIEKVLDGHDPALIITVGGTGLCPRDVTPEATSVLYEKHCSGISTALHMNSLRYTGHAALSRLTSGIVGGTLIINFPGKLKACKECMSCIRLILEHALEQVRYDYVAYNGTHRRQKQQADMQQSDTMDSILSSSSLYSNSNNNLQTASQETISDPMRSSSRKSGPPSESSGNGKLTIEAIKESRKESSLCNQGLLNDNKPRELVTTQQKVPLSKKFYMKRKKQTANLSSQTQPAKQKQQPPPPKAIQPKTVSQPIVTLPSVRILPSQSPYRQVPYDECLTILSGVCSELFQGPEEVVLNTFSKGFTCIGTTLAEDLNTKRIVPPFPVSTVDGYVLNVPTEMNKIVDKIKKLPEDIQLLANLNEFERMQVDRVQKDKFFCCQINTGGRLPKFNYAVVPTEKAVLNENGSVTIREVKQFVYIRKAGVDINDQDVIKAGTVIGAVELSSIIAMGHKTFKILQRPKIGVLSTGDELEDFFVNEYAGQSSVVDTNGPLLRAMFRSLGYFVMDCGIVKDEPYEILGKIKDALKKCDVLLITGGASMGTKDHVKDVIHHLNGTIHFGRADIKPGKPVAFASIMVDDKKKFIFSLPGNPVSAFITAIVLVYPFLKHAPERYLGLPKKISGHLGENILAKIGKLESGKEPYVFDGRLEFIRAKILEKEREFAQDSPKSIYKVQVSVKQQSSRLLSLVDCDCLIMIDPSKKGQHLLPGYLYPALKLAHKF